MASQITGSNPALSAKPVTTTQTAMARPALPGTGQATETTQTLPQGGKVLPDQKPAVSQQDASQAVEEAVKQVNSFVQNVQRSLNFSVDEGSGKTVVKVFDADSNTLIRQIPSEEVLALAAHLQEMAAGQEDISGGMLFRADA